MKINKSINFSKQTGFTLIEIMIAIAIIAILASIATVAYNYYIKSAEEAVIEETVSELRHVTDLYVTTHGKLPVSMSQLGITEAAGLVFKLQSNTNDAHAAQIFAYASGQKIPFVINISNTDRKLCWDCVPASQAGINSSDIASQFYLPAECRVVNNNNCSSVQSGSTQGSSSVAGQNPATTNVNPNNLPQSQSPSITPPQKFSCQSGEEIIHINGVKACAPKCGVMEVRDPQNLINCIPIPVQQPVIPTCSPTEELVNNQCVAKCAAGEHRNPADGSCQSNCSVGQAWSGGACQNICSGNSSFNSQTGGCDCNSGYEAFQGQCLKECSSGEHRNSADGSCQSNCSVGQTWTGGACQNICSGNSSFNSQTGGCGCNSGFEDVNGSCQAVCNAGQRRNSNGLCENISCPTGQKFDPNLNICSNPCGYHHHWIEGYGCCNYHDNRDHNRCP